jgi:hypothetical protein
MGNIIPTLENLGSLMFDGAKAALGKKASLVTRYLKSESEKLAITLRMITEGVLKGEISEAEAKILLKQQKIAAIQVLTAAEGMGILAAQESINAALKVVKDFINGKIGFALL